MYINKHIFLYTHSKKMDLKKEATNKHIYIYNLLKAIVQYVDTQIHVSWLLYIHIYIYILYVSQECDINDDVQI